MTKIQTILGAVIFAVLFATVQPCRADDTNVLKVGVTPNFPPMIYKKDGKIVGVEADFANALGETLGRKVKFVEVDWEDQISDLTDGRTDIIMSGMSVTLSRELRIAFSKPYLVTGQIALVRREDANQYLLGFPARPAGAIGVMTATTGDFLVQQEFPRNKRKEYDKAEDAAKALVKKRINIFICDAPTIWWLVGRYEDAGLVAVPVQLTREQLAWGMRRSDTDLLNSVNAAMDRMQADGRASQIMKRWIPLLK